MNYMIDIKSTLKKNLPYQKNCIRNILRCKRQSKPQRLDNIDLWLMVEKEIIKGMQMKQRMILLADANSLWTKRYIEYVTLPLQLDVVLITNTDTKNKAFYSKNAIKVVTLFEGEWYARIPKIRSLLGQKKLIAYLKNIEYDYLNVFFVFEEIPKIFSKISDIKAKKILTYLGSDLLRKTSIVNSIEMSMLEQADHVIVMSQDMKNTFIKRYSGQFVEKVDIIGMGVSAFSFIDKKRNEYQTQKESLIGSENKNKTTITIGYNAIPQQQHLSVLNVLSTISDDEKMKYHLILPLTYLRSNLNYLRKIEQEVASSGFSYTILDKFMNDEKISGLCISTDIFINAQITDAMSASLLEHIYSTSYVISGSWLKYQPLLDIGIQLESFTEFTELPEKINNFSYEYKAQRLLNVQLVKDNFSWEITKDKWSTKIFHL